MESCVTTNGAQKFTICSPAIKFNISTCLISHLPSFLTKNIAACVWESADEDKCFGLLADSCRLDSRRIVLNDVGGRFSDGCGTRRVSHTTNRPSTASQAKLVGILLRERNREDEIESETRQSKRNDVALFAMKNSLP